MERLEACYFCGTAADVREVSISPRNRQGDPDAAVGVTLCPACEDKLQQVLGGLFDRVESRPTGDASGSGGDAAGEDGPAAEPTPEPLDRIDVGGDDPPAWRGRRGRYTDPAEADETAEPGDREGARAGGAPADEDAEFVEDGPRVRARRATADPDALDGVSVAEYNRVMRLLQNREFPMARAAFVDLAASAYDLGEDTVQQVLDAVIEQGTLADREGDLVRPGEGGEAAP